jgi:hypothetical protein
VITHGGATAPPSVHPSGKAYQWHGDPRCIPRVKTLADIGIELSRAEIDWQRPLQDETLLDRRKAEHIFNVPAYVMAAIMGERQHIRTATVGRRNNQLYRSALKLAKYTEMVSPALIMQELSEAALASGLEKNEVQATIYSGLNRGISNGVLPG